MDFVRDNPGEPVPEETLLQWKTNRKSFGLSNGTSTNDILSIIYYTKKYK